MRLRIASLLRPAIAVLAITMLVVALACAGEEEPTAAPTAQPTPTTPAASTPLTVDGQATATPVPDDATMELTWIERYLKSPGYDPAWGEPVKGGTFIFGAQRDGTTFHPREQSCCYTHGCYAGLPMNSLFRIDAWTGNLTTVEGDLVESWELSDDGKTLTMQLRQGVMFFDRESLSSMQKTETTIPDEFNGGQILGDELVCEDAKASIDRFVWPPEWETRYTHGKAYLGHLESTSCPDGPRAHTFLMHFTEPRGKTLGILGGDAATIFDADFIAWNNDWGQREGRPTWTTRFRRTSTPCMARARSYPRI